MRENVKVRNTYNFQKNIVKNNFIKFEVVLIAFFVSVLFPRIAFALADYMGEIFHYKQFSVIWDLIHHTIQMGLALLVMILPFWKRTLAQWGLNNWEKEKNKKIIIKFITGFIIFFTVGKLFYLWLSGWPSALDFNPNEYSVWKRIIFRLIMPGLSEEILFRGLIMGIIMVAWQNSFRIGKYKISLAGIIAAVFFTLAHIGFNFVPFQITYYNIGQLIFAFIFGVFYSIVYMQTKSLLAPIIIHNVIDGLSTFIDYILTIVIKGVIC